MGKGRKLTLEERVPEIGTVFLGWKYLGEAYINPRNVPMIMSRHFCGFERYANLYRLRAGRSVEYLKCSGKHGQTETRLYKIWESMKARCNNPNNYGYKNYGGRGISICQEWDDFLAFKFWAEQNGYKAELELDRINVHGGYSPDNCRWSTRKENMQNTRRSRLVTAFGETKTLSAWAEDSKCKVSKNTLANRLNTGLDPELAITLPLSIGGQKLGTEKPLNRTERRRLTFENHVAEKLQNLRKIDKFDFPINSIFGKWKFLGEVYKDQKYLYLKCQCSCGIIDILSKSNLDSGGSTQCRFCSSKGHATTTTHGQSKSRLWYVWISMRKRCTDSNTVGYGNYGGRGITYCSEWEKFENFIVWAQSNGYSDELELDRIDVNGNYEPRNCRWVTPKENCRNKRNNTKVEAFGEIKTLIEWSEDPRCTVKVSTLSQRIRRNIDPETAITSPSDRGKNLQRK